MSFNVSIFRLINYLTQQLRYRPTIELIQHTLPHVMHNRPIAISLDCRLKKQLQSSQAGLLLWRFAKKASFSRYRPKPTDYNSFDSPRLYWALGLLFCKAAAGGDTRLTARPMCGV